MMSGGVDSSVAAFLLAKNKNYEVVGCFIKGYNVDGCQERDAEDARRTAEYLKIPFYAIDLENEYKKLVVDYMIGGYRRGITPNPDVMCNKEIKFGLFLKKALAMGAGYVATGHYVRIKNAELRIKNKTEKIYKLFQAKDKTKDQSYFLWTLTQKQLKHCLFPIGGYLKNEVRKIAGKAGLPTAEKKDSQGICFLGTVNFKDFLKQYLPVKRGDILDVEGKKIGEHDGVWFYTVGQRHIGASFQPPSAGRRTDSQKNRKPFYVAEKNIKKNTLIVAEGEDNPILYKKEIGLIDVNFLNPLILDPQPSILIMARVRYRQPLANAELRIKNSEFRIIFDKPQKFIASGQSAVFYLPAEVQKTKAGDKKGSAGVKALANTEMLGGGIIA